MTENQTEERHTKVQDADDIRSLVKHLDTGKFDYIDVSAIESWRRALNHWPLLRELNNWYQDR